MAAPVRLTSTPHILQAMSGSPQHLCTIVATTTKNNHDTAVAFNNTGDALKSRPLLLQSDAAFYVRGVTTNDGTVTETNGVYVQALQPWVLWLRSDEGWVACLAVAGTATVRVFELI